MPENSNCSGASSCSKESCEGCPSNGNKNWDFLHVADQTLYRVKRRGRNRLCMTDIHGREIEV